MNIMLDSRTVRRRYRGIAHVALWRWQNNPSLGFRAPVRINGRDYWRECDLDEFGAKMQAAAMTPEAADRRLADRMKRHFERHGDPITPRRTTEARRLFAMGMLPPEVAEANGVKVEEAAR